MAYEAGDGRRRWAAMLIGMMGLAGLCRLTMSGSAPSLMSPFSLVVVVPFLILGSELAWGLVPLVFLLSSLHLMRGRAAPPRFALVALWVLTLLDALWLIMGWRAGVSHYGAAHVRALAAANLVFVMVLFALARRLRRRATWPRDYAFRWLLCAWPAWMAFPWLGANL